MAKKWTEKEDDYLLAYYKDKSLMQLADNLNRSVKAIQSRLRTLGALNKHEKKDREPTMLIQFRLRRIQDL